MVDPQKPFFRRFCDGPPPPPPFFLPISCTQEDPQEAGDVEGLMSRTAARFSKRSAAEEENFLDAMGGGGGGGEGGGPSQKRLKKGL